MIEVTEIAEGMSLEFQAFVTPTVWTIIQNLSQSNEIKLQENLRFILHILNIAICRRKGQKGGPIHFSVGMESLPRGEKPLSLKAFLSCTPAGQPAITIMMPCEKEGVDMANTQAGSLEACQCFQKRCKHYGGMIQEDGQAGWRHTCKAFPDGIPQEIWEGKNQHFEPLPDQENKIVFEKAETYAGMEMFRTKRGVE